MLIITRVVGIEHIRDQSDGFELNMQFVSGLMEGEPYEREKAWDDYAFAYCAI